MNSINIIQPTKNDPYLKISGNGTFQLRQTFRTLGFKWNSENKSWDRQYDATRLFELESTESRKLIISKIKSIAQTKSIHVVEDKEQDITFNDIIKASKAMKITKKKHKRRTNMDRNRKNVKTEDEYIEPKVSYGRIELHGNTYRNKDWLKDTFDAKFDRDNRIWWIDMNTISLRKVKLILEDYSLLKDSVDGDNRNRSRSRSRDRNRNRNYDTSENDNINEDIYEEDDDYVESDYGFMENRSTVIEANDSDYKDDQ
eukprot:185020_1